MQSKIRIPQTPRSVDIAITARCNLRCKYCGHFTSPGDVEDVSLSSWISFFEELNKCAVMDVCLQGGEPFIRNDLEDIVKGIVKNRMRFSILSNGSLITEKMAIFISATRRCNSIQISLDGSQSNIHDSMRGEGSFISALQGMNILKKHNITFNVRVTIHKQNVHHLREIAQFLLEEMGLSGFGTNSASYAGLCRKNTEQVQLTSEERSLAMKTLLELSRQYPNRINATAGPLAEVRHWLRMVKLQRENKSAELKTGFLVGCGGVFQKIAVRADGVLVPCIQLSHIELGRINVDSLKDVWQNHSQLRLLRERRAIPLKNFPYCSECDYIGSCTGNCPAMSYTLSNTVFAPAKDSCLRKFLEDGGSLPDERILEGITI